MNATSVVLGASLIWLAVIISPGPNFLVVSRLALSRSRRTAVGATVGFALGSVFYAALAMFGLGAAIVHLGWFGDGIRIVGGGYLAWLGIQAWRGGAEKEPFTEGPLAGDGPSIPRGFRVGLLSELTNPKGIAFFLGLFTAAVPAATPLGAKLGLLMTGGCLEIAWYVAVAFALSSGPVRNLYRSARRSIDRVVGAVLIGLGIKVAFEAA